MSAMGRAVWRVPECVARRNPSLRVLRLKGGGVQRTLGLSWRKGLYRRELMRELVDDLSRGNDG